MTGEEQEAAGAGSETAGVELEAASAGLEVVSAKPETADADAEAAGAKQEAADTEAEAAGAEPEAANAESGRKKYIARRAAVFLNSAAILAAITAAAILVETLLLPVLQIYGSSMEPALYEGDYVIAMRYTAPKRGDIVAFYNSSKILVKRVIALPGELVDLDEDGRVYIDGEQLDEPYLEKTALGGCDIGLPCKVPEGTVFVMGDNRGVSVDSRNSSVGFVPEKQLIGKLVFRVWPQGGRIKKGNK